MAQFTLGPGLHGNLDELIVSRLLAQANSGGGKSWLLRRLLEQTHGKVQQIVIDPEGEFASLREKYDYVLAAKTGGDTVADVRTAGLLAERLLQLGVSAIVDIYELKAHERVTFVKLFLDAMVNAPKELWHPVLVVLDEAHKFCPEKDQAESAGAVKDLCTLGRKRGFCAVLATQRLSKLSKDAAAECNNKLIGRTTLDVDAKRAADELGFTTTGHRIALRDLRPGEFWAYGPAFESGGQAVVQVGPVHTSHPKAGGRLHAAIPPPTAAIKKLLPQLSDLPKEAEERAHTVQDLRDKIRKLERALKEKGPVEKAPPVIVEKPVISDKTLKTIDRFTDKIDKVSLNLARHQETVSTTLREMADTVRSIIVPMTGLMNQGRSMSSQSPGNTKTTTVPPARLPAPPARATKTTTPGSSQAAGSAPSGTKLQKMDRGVLQVLAWFQQDGCHIGKIALLSRYKVSGGFRNALARLRNAGFMVGGNTGSMKITEAGFLALGDYDEMPDGPELARWWLANPSFGKMDRQILQALIDNRDGLDIHSLGEATQYEVSGGFRNALTRLRTAGVLIGRNTEVMQVSDLLL